MPTWTSSAPAKKWRARKTGCWSGSWPGQRWCATSCWSRATGRTTSTLAPGFRWCTPTSIRCTPRCPPWPYSWATRQQTRDAARCCCTPCGVAPCTPPPCSRRRRRRRSWRQSQRQTRRRRSEGSRGAVLSGELAQGLVLELQAQHRWSTAAPGRARVLQRVRGTRQGSATFQEACTGSGLCGMGGAMGVGVRAWAGL